MDEKHKKKLLRDIIFLGMSVVIALLIAWTGAAHSIVERMGNWGLVGVFLAGMTFSSAFTSAPAIVILFGLAQDYHPLWLFVFIAAAGAMCSDLLIFRFLRDGLDEDIQYFISHSSGFARLRVLVRSRLFYWMASIMAALVIASPLPDEFGLALFGFLRMNKRFFLPISFAMNSLGIMVVGLAAQITHVQ